MEGNCRIAVRDEEKGLIKTVAGLLGVSRAQYLGYLYISADKLTFERYSRGNSECSWEDFCEESQKEMENYHEVRRRVRGKNAESLVNRCMKVREYGDRNGKSVVVNETDLSFLTSKY